VDWDKYNRRIDCLGTLVSAKNKNSTPAKVGALIGEGINTVAGLSYFAGASSGAGEVAYESFQSGSTPRDQTLAGLGNFALGGVTNRLAKTANFATKQFSGYTGKINYLEEAFSFGETGLNALMDIRHKRGK